MRRMMGKGALLVAVVVLAIGAVLLQTASSQVTGTTLNLNFPKSEPDSLTGSNGPSIGDVFSFKGGITDETDASVGHLLATAHRVRARTLQDNPSMTADEIRTIVTCGEEQTLEFKETTAQMPRAAKTLAASVIMNRA